MHSEDTWYMVLGTLYLFLKILGLSADRQVHCTWYLVQSLVKQIPTNPQIQERSVAGVVWSYEIPFLSHQTGIQVVVLEKYSSSVDSEIHE